jgi:hypothetical protein
MADAPASTAKNPLEILKQKVGPLPLWVWLGAAAALWWYFQSQQSSAAANPSAVPNQQTDPAGNIGTIDPATGYVYGTPEDLAALTANNAGTSTTAGGTAGQNATTGAQTYADNNAWGIAAVNYLVGLGIDATTANQAITLYLASQPLTTAEQGDVNLAIQSLGAPPSLPGPISSSPAPVTTAGSGGTTTTGSGSGSTGGGGSPTTAGQASTSNGHVISRSNNDAVVGWTGHNASLYKAYIQGPGYPAKIPATAGSTPQASFSGLQAGHNYVVTVIPYNSAGQAGITGTISVVTTS